ncbi:MAG: hypothetical protein ATN31_08540 [Candidatus Epulonipiscioides saccharophilum]|nr:MAG: hypothetical protein ATN31_08540 [Epulopiscium sp. AS2M-Bin001]
MDLSINYQEINNILMDFYHLTGFRIALFNAEFQELLAYPTRLSTFCKLLRDEAKLEEICKKSDYEAFCKCQKTSESLYYKCHMGMTEMLVPIKIEENIIGYIMTGQIYEENTTSWPKLAQYLNIEVEGSLAYDKLEQIYNNKQKLTSKQMHSAFNILNVITKYLCQNEKITKNKHKFAYKLDQFIIDNIDQDIDVNMLCKKFEYQKTTFYKVTNECYGTSIMKHVMQLRIQFAKKLLLNTNLPISIISSQVGINDYNYFTKVFKKEAKCTPREFRKNNIYI